MGENFIGIASKKLTETLHFLFNLGGQAMKKIDEVFPPQTRSETLQRWTDVGETFIFMALQKIKEGLLLLFHLVETSWSGSTPNRLIKLGASVVLAVAVGWMFLGKGKTMKAPGRDYRISRRSFEKNPKGYFRNLHEK
ncbi:hypothetical protein QJS04_geneDACA023303 [Acorus gramineus]|uniref:Uncharacterized protein n=1 Tax=Acorus gramineus TaxID=55184 RepID=A0AAV9B9V2_ACOGR|nr:hypothetical protein QJS04_geneDACA023303 [Acorus gramineus]